MALTQMKQSRQGRSHFCHTLGKEFFIGHSSGLEKWVENKSLNSEIERQSGYSLITCLCCGGVFSWLVCALYLLTRKWGGGIKTLNFLLHQPQMTTLDKAQCGQCARILVGKGESQLYVSKASSSKITLFHETPVLAITDLHCLPTHILRSQMHIDANANSKCISLGFSR